ncbi:MAG: AIR synthase-related protein [Myxococcales bacterium]|nr:AIR synthase-related protein [Myxococcales bacterium]
MSRAALPPGKLPHRLLANLLNELPSADGVVLGPGVGRDVAVIEGRDGLWLATSDPITFATDRIGRYAVTVNVNDIATAGGVPTFFLATLLLPEGATTEASVRAIFEEIAAACREFGVGWIGGHTEVTLGLDRVIVAGTMLGEVAREGLVRSDGGRAGDVVLCAGRVPLEGGALVASGCRGALTAAGFGVDVLGELEALLDAPGLCVLPAARALCAAVRPHAMHDPTEGGIATALWELAEAAGTGIRVDADAIPWHPLAARAARTLGLDPLGLIASGALLAAVAPEDETAALAALASAGVPATTIATLVPEARGRVLVEAGRERPLPVFAADEIARAFSSN